MHSPIIGNSASNYQLFFADLLSRRDTPMSVGKSDDMRPKNGARAANANLGFPIALI